jgi:hypothetical protein
MNLQDNQKMEITTRNDFGHLAQRFYKTGVGAEIGVERGNFSKLMLTQYMGNLVEVDMWANEKIYTEAMKNLNTPRSIIRRQPSVEAAETMPDESLDFVYIDADHDYFNCKRDIEAWFPKVRHGGLVAGHDYLNWEKSEGAGCEFGVKAAVDEYCARHGYKLHVTTDDYFEGNPYPTWWFVKEIPRIIYYTWVNPDPLPERFQKYIDGWKVLMPDYQIKEICLANIVRTPFVEEAIRRGKYSVAGHYGRCERLFVTGGIYFDIDVEAVKRFDDLLGAGFFAGCEAPHRVNNAVMGSVPGHKLLEECLYHMDNFDFDRPGPLGLEIETGPELFTKILKEWGWKERNSTQFMAREVTVFNSRYFYPYYFDKKYYPGCVDKETYAVHHWAKTW